MHVSTLGDIAPLLPGAVDLVAMVAAQLRRYEDAIIDDEQGKPQVAKARVAVEVALHELAALEGTTRALRRHPESFNWSLWAVEDQRADKERQQEKSDA